MVTGKIFMRLNIICSMSKFFNATDEFMYRLPQLTDCLLFDESTGESA